ncbi:MAG: hypothetical protein EA370_11260, partial [Wenzhouxiangella sp.]
MTGKNQGRPPRAEKTSEKTSEKAAGRSARKTAKKPSRNRPGRREQANAAPPAQFEGTERLQKVLAAAGLGSRRALEKRIEAGAIELNGKVAELGATVRCGDRIA